MALSVVGLLACLAGAAGVWMLKGRVDRAAMAVFTAADDAYEFMHTRLAIVHQRLDSSRERVDGLAARAERLRTMEAGSQPEASDAAEIESLRSMLDQVASEMRAAETWLDSIEAVARGVNVAAESIADARKAASQPVGGAQDTSPGLVAARVAELADGLADAVRRLDALRAKLLEMRENRMLAKEFAAGVIAAAADLDTRLGNLTTRIDDLNGRVAAAQRSSIDAARRIHGWIALGAIVLTAVLLWFGASQVCVLSRAWRLFRTMS